MIAKNELPEDGYIVFPRRIALITAIGLVVSVGGPVLSLWITSQAHERRIEDNDRRLLKMEERRDTDHDDIQAMKADIRIIRQLLERDNRSGAR